MSKSATYVRHKAKPGKRDEVRRVWDRYARDFVAGNDGVVETGPFSNGVANDGIGFVDTGEVNTFVGEFTIADGGPGEVTMGLRQELVDIQRGRAEDPFGWVHRVL